MHATIEYPKLNYKPKRSDTSLNADLDTNLAGNIVVKNKFKRKVKVRVFDYGTDILIQNVRLM